MSESKPNAVTRAVGEVLKLPAGICVYCCTAHANTVDHVPGKQLFPDPKPSNLVTVPACRACNSRLQRDEDYFRALFCLGRGGVGRAGSALWNQKLHRTFQKDRGLTRLIASSLQRLPLVSESGLYLGTRMGVKIDWERVHRVAGKWVRALFFEEYEEAVGPQTMITVRVVHGSIEQLRDRYLTWANPGKHSWPGIFEYSHGRVENRPESSMWLFRVLDVYEFLACTGSGRPRRFA